MGQEKDTIDQFAGWEEPKDVDFFAEKDVTKQVVETVLEDDVTATPTVSEADKLSAAEKKIEEDLFKAFSNPEVEEDEDEGEDNTTGPNDTDKNTPVKINSKSTLEFLKEKGLVEYELAEGEELTETLAEELLEDSWDKALEQEVEATIKELPNEIKDLIKYAAKGGNVGELLGKMIQNVTSPITKTSDITQESTQVLAVTADLKAQGYDQEYIDTQIEFLKEKGKLEDMGKKAYDKIIAKQEQDIKAQVEAQTSSIEEKKKKARTYKANITTHIDTLTEVKGLPVSKQDKLVLPSYISDPTVELEDGRFVSGLQADLFEVMGDKDNIILLAKLLKSKFDFSAIERKKETQASRGIKNEIQRAEKDKTDRTTGGRSTSKKKAIWDMLD
jgi:hypothetical protein